MCDTGAGSDDHAVLDQNASSAGDLDTGADVPRDCSDALGMAGAAALRFTLVASAVVLAILGDHFVRSGDLKWAATPLVISIVCLTLAATRRQPSSHRPLTGPPRFGSFMSDSNARFGIELNERSLGLGMTVGAAVLMYVSLRNFGQVDRGSLTLAWYSFGAAATLALAAIPTIDGRWTALIGLLKAADHLQISLRDVAPWLTVAAIIALAAGLRLYNLDDLPAGLWFDEADNVFHARQYANDPGQTPVFAPSTNLPTLFLLPVAAIVKLAGVAVTTPRLVAVSFGLLGIVATFLFVRHAFTTSAALIAAALVAVMRWDINWSRIGMHGITGVLFASLTAWLTLRAIHNGRTSDYAFAGAALGLGMWFYASFRMFVLVVGFMLLLHMLVDRPRIRPYVANVVTMVLVALFIMAPVIQYAAGHPEEFFGRTEDTSLFSLIPREDWADRLASSLVQHAFMFNRDGDPNPRHNLPEAPMLDRLTAALFVIGFFFALTQWRNIALFTLPFWVFFMVLPGVLTVPWEAPQSLRSILVIPAVAALAAIVVDQLWRTWRDVSWRRVSRLALPAVLALIGVVAYANVDLYFGDQADDPRVYAAFSTDETLVARSQIEQRRLGYSLWVSRQFLHGLTGTLLADHPKLEVLAAPETLPLDSTDVWHGAAAYFEPREMGFWEVMRAYYPDAGFRAVAAPAGGEAIFYTGFASRQKLADRQGLDVVYFADGVKLEGRRDTVTDSVWWAESGPQEYPYSVRLEGALHIPEFGEYQFIIDSPDTAMDLNGQRILDGDDTSGRVALAAGLHGLSISAQVEGPNDFVRVLWESTTGQLTEIPFSRLYRGSVRPLGLAGRFYSGKRSSGEPDSLEVTPSMDLFHYTPVIPEPYTAIWEGTVDVDAPGLRRFRTARTGSGEISLYVDDHLVAQDPPDDDIAAEGKVNLAQGRHSLRVEYRPESSPSRFEILWARGESGGYGPIPVELMRPAPEHMMWLVE